MRGPVEKGRGGEVQTYRVKGPAPHGLHWRIFFARRRVSRPIFACKPSCKFFRVQRLLGQVDD